MIPSSSWCCPSPNNVIRMLAFCGIGGRGATPPAGHVARPSVMPGPPIRGGCGDQRSVLSSEAGPYPRPEPIADEVGTCSRGFYISAGTFRGLLAINQLFTQRVTRGVRVSADLSRIFSDHVPVFPPTHPFFLIRPSGSARQGRKDGVYIAMYFSSLA